MKTKHWFLSFLIIALVALFAAPVQAEKKEYEITAYCACKKCCGKWSGGPTASGVKPVEGVTVAAPRSIPFHTKIHIEGVGNRVVHDRLAKKYDHRIDVYFASHDAALKFGKQKRIVTF